MFPPVFTLPSASICQALICISFCLSPTFLSAPSLLRPPPLSFLHLSSSTAFQFLLLSVLMPNSFTLLPSLLHLCLSPPFSHSSLFPSVSVLLYTQFLHSFDLLAFLSSPHFYLLSPPFIPSSVFPSVSPTLHPAPLLRLPSPALLPLPFILPSTFQSLLHLYSTILSSSFISFLPSPTLHPALLSFALLHLRHHPPPPSIPQHLPPWNTFDFY